MTKTKLKIILFLFFSLIGLTIGFFFSGYINLLLTGGSIDDISALRPAVIMASLKADGRHRMLTLCVELVIVAGIATLMLMSRRETFESDTSAIAGSINTPVAIGQGQHGTARWLKPSERQQAFAVYYLDGTEPNFAALLDAGARDRKEVTTYQAESENKTVNNGGITDGGGADQNAAVSAPGAPVAETPESKKTGKAE
jgi:type IV secretion system protein VirD4